MPSSNRAWKGNFIERFVKTAPSKSNPTTGKDTVGATASSASFDRSTEQPPSNNFHSESAVAQNKEACGSSCRCHAGDRFPDHSRNSTCGSRPSAVRLLSMIQEGLPNTPPAEMPSPSHLTLYSTNSTASPGTPISRRQSLYMPSDRRPVYDEHDEYSRGRNRGRKSSELSMYKMGRCRGMSPRPSLDSPFGRSRPYGEA